MDIWKHNQKRCNPHAPYTDENGARYAAVPSYLYEYHPDPVRESDETHYNQEIDDAPYLICTPKSPEQLATLRWQKIKQLRDEKIANGGCKVGENWFHSDTHSKVQQIGLVLAGANLPDGIGWKTMSGDMVPMTPTLASQLYLAQMAQEQAIFAVAEAKKSDQSDLNVGWPETYTPKTAEIAAP